MTSIYSNPPIKERVMLLTARIDKDIYAAQKDIFVDQIIKIFPERKDIPGLQFTVDISGKDGSSKNTLAPQREVVLESRFCKDKTNSFFLRFNENSITLNYVNHSSTDSGSYDVIIEEFKKIFPMWKNTFKIEKFSTLSIQYFNELRKERIAESDGRLFFRKYVNTFPVFPMDPGHVATPPLFSEFTIMLGDKAKSFINAKTILTDKNDLNLFLSYLHNLDEVATSDSIIEFFNIGHDVIKRHFELYFTDEAKKLFQKT